MVPIQSVLLSHDSTETRGVLGGVYAGIRHITYQPPVYFAGVYSPQLPYMNRVYAGYKLTSCRVAYSAEPVKKGKVCVIQYQNKYNY